MPLRLSELLERIRPAGSPGAPTEGEKRIGTPDHANELAEIASVLAVFEREAAALVDAATAMAAALARDAERQVRQIRSSVPDRIARAEAAAVRGHDQRFGVERRRMEAQTAGEVARLEAQGDELVPSLVVAAIDLIWVAADAQPATEDQR